MGLIACGVNNVTGLVGHWLDLHDSVKAKDLYQKAQKKGYKKSFEDWLKNEKMLTSAKLGLNIGITPIALKGIASTYKESEEIIMNYDFDEILNMNEDLDMIFDEEKKNNVGKGVRYAGAGLGAAATLAGAGMMAHQYIKDWKADRKRLKDLNDPKKAKEMYEKRNSYETWKSKQEEASKRRNKLRTASVLGGIGSGIMSASSMLEDIDLEDLFD